MNGRLVGRVEALWRYPVKSMLGECLPQVEVGEGGICGDRAYALWDHATGRVASAKNPRLWRSLLQYQAQFVAPPLPGQALPAAAISAAADRAAGTEAAPLLTSDPEAGAQLSAWLGRQVSLLDRPQEGASLDQYWPPVQEREFQDVVNELVLPAGTFFDSCPIHAISTATLDRLRQLEPDLDFAVERFRPNLLMAPLEGDEGFVEEAWLGHRLRIGKRALLQVDTACPRCVITTLAQCGLPEDIEILRATARHNKVIAGIRLSVLTPGPVAVGDPITLLEEGAG
ncbi:MAG: MOSC domain-containing protein [Cyanobium sp.]|uniref:MOSC domain-containing protein n=1 Tax=Synechococcus sp. CS-1333 TaxID=2848638 RepID=UPI000DBC2596|nr:MOSC domain-containing protein [Synechococcus sp. CS-1333]MCT0209204.1 MOSC domain-containing protein [Synechococcus sp. CS-1333]PZV21811.1 MAG: MOSC domain-containing protein [Cyanobium sp.]